MTSYSPRYNQDIDDFFKLLGIHGNILLSLLRGVRSPTFHIASLASIGKDYIAGNHYHGHTTDIHSDLGPKISKKKMITFLLNGV